MNDVSATVFPGESEMAARCRAFEWAATSLGPPSEWPVALRTMVRVCLESPFPVNLWCGAELRLIYNDAYRRVLGAKHPSALGRPGLDVWADIRDDIEPMFAGIRAGGPPVYAEDARFVMERASEAPDGHGEAAWFTFGLSPIRDDVGAIVGFFNPATETTARMLAERQLETANHEIAEANAQLQEQAAELEVSSQQLEEQQVELELTNQHLQEQQRELEAQVQAVGEGRLALEVAAREQTRLLAELQFERDRLRQAFDQSPGFVTVLEGADHRYVYVNGPYNQIAGHRALLGLTVREAFPELAGQGFYELLDGVYSTGVAFVGSALPVQLEPVRGGPVEERRIDLIYQPLTALGDDGTAHVTGILVQGRDVTEDARAAEALAEAARERERLLAESEAERRRAVDANSAKAQFLANMSHELRTPLNAIGGYAELIEMGLHGAVTEGQRGALGRIRRAQQHLLGLINDILNYAKLESGRIEYDVRVVDLRDVVHDVAPLVEPQLAAKGLTFEVSIPGDQCLVWADRDKLNQVLANLLSNAAKFTDPKRSGATGTPPEPDVAITLGTEPGDLDGRGVSDAPPELAYLRVSDRGRGIPADKQEAVFEPFVQVGQRFAGEHAGTGLGLAISRDLARGMGGDLQVRSVEGEGTTFTVALRRAV